MIVLQVMPSVLNVFFFRVLLHAGNSYGHFIYLIYVISWGTYSICRLPELIIYLDETKWKNCSCNVLLFGYSDDILNLTQDCVLDYVGKSFFFLQLLNKLLQPKCNVIIFEHNYDKHRICSLLGNELSEQKVDITGCPYDSSGLWGMFLVCCVTFTIYWFQNLSRHFLCTNPVTIICEVSFVLCSCTLTKLYGKMQNISKMAEKCHLECNLLRKPYSAGNL